MAGFSSLLDFKAAMDTDFKVRELFFDKQPTSNISLVHWYELFTTAGTPPAGTLESGTPGVATRLDSDSTGALHDTGLISSLVSQFLVKSWSQSSGLGSGVPEYVFPTCLLLCDFLLVYPSCVTSGSPTALDNTVTLPRYTDGEGVVAIAVNVDIFSGSANCALDLTYTNQAGTTGRSAGRTFLKTDGSAITEGALYKPSDFGSSESLARTTPFISLASGDSGVRKIESYTISTSATGEIVSFVLIKPLALLPLVADRALVEKDYFLRLPSFIKIEHDACLSFLAFTDFTGFGNQGRPHIQGCLTLAWT